MALRLSPNILLAQSTVRSCRLIGPWAAESWKTQMDTCHAQIGQLYALEVFGGKHLGANIVDSNVCIFEGQLFMHKSVKSNYFILLR